MTCAREGCQEYPTTLVEVGERHGFYCLAHAREIQAWHGGADAVVPLFPFGIDKLEAREGDTVVRSVLFLPCDCTYEWEGPEMGYQRTSLCAHHGAMQAALALEMFALEEHAGHALGIATYYGTTCLECHTCERTLIEISSSGERVTP